MDGNQGVYDYEVAYLVKSYLKEVGCKKTLETFLTEHPTAAQARPPHNRKCLSLVSILNRYVELTKKDNLMLQIINNSSNLIQTLQQLIETLGYDDIYANPDQMETDCDRLEDPDINNQKTVHKFQSGIMNEEMHQRLMSDSKFVSQLTYKINESYSPQSPQNDPRQQHLNKSIFDSRPPSITDDQVHQIVNSINYDSFIMNSTDTSHKGSRKHFLITKETASGLIDGHKR